ncbi:MAG TPA: DUF4097 family beta strand repeat-containing protein [Candidatus Limnocylindrales bacterium]|nr:DUF4097 family beta strand repeat-containing protein [Candidatus Limnocylindrales bacterium]
MTTLDETTGVITHRIGRHGSVAIKLAAAEIRLTGTDTDQVVVRSLDGRPLPSRVTVETTEDALTIREREHFGLTFAIGEKTVQLDVELPAEADLTVDTASGDIEARDLRGEQRYRTASGDTRLDGAGGTIELNSVSGDTVIALAASADLAIRSVSGDVSVSGGEITALRIGTTSGDIRVDSPIRARTGTQIDTLSGDVSLVAEAGMRVDARTVSGDLTSDLPHRSDGRMGRRTLVVGDGSVEVAFRSVSGDLQVHDARRRGAAPPAAPVRPAPPAPPAPPRAPAGPDAATDAAGTPVPSDDERLEILRALEAGELDVATAMDRLAALDAADEERSDG